MTPQLSRFPVSRRTALVGAAGGGLAAATRGRVGSAQDASQATLAGHPLTGVWMAMANPPLPDSPQIAAPSVFSADGSVLLMFPLTQVGPQGVVFNSPYIGTWQSDGERRGHFTAVQVLSDANGTFLGTTTVDGREFCDHGRRDSCRDYRARWPERPQVTEHS